MSVALKNIVKTFGNFVALDNVSLQFGPGELTALLGPSGCGKTTLLRIIAGLETADSGRVLIHGEDASHQSVRDRRIGFVFQHYALFRHMTIFENVAFGLRVQPRAQRLSDSQIKARVGALLERVRLDHLAGRYPAQLSGGQRQRIALARALAIEPRLLLLDEPFGALDATVRKELRRWLRRLHEELHITTVFVTHDQDEALELSDRVVVLNRGRIEQEGAPEEVYHAPASSFVFGFLGSANVFQGQLVDGHFEVEGRRLGPAQNVASADQTGMRTAYARLHETRISRDLEQGAPAIIKRIVEIGPVVRVELEGADHPTGYEAELTKSEIEQAGLKVGERVSISSIRLRAY